MISSVVFWFDRGFCVRYVVLATRGLRAVPTVDAAGSIVYIKGLRNLEVTVINAHSPYT